MRFLTIVPLCLALAACGEDPAPDEATNASTAAAPGSVVTETAPSIAMSPYQQALRHWRTQPTYKLSVEVSSELGQTTIEGAHQSGRHLLTVQTSPTNDVDGRWLLQAGRYLREVNGQFEPSLRSLDNYAAVQLALGMLPDNDDSAKPDTASGGSCTLRQLEVAQLPSLAERYSSFEVCISPEPHTIVELRAVEHTGRRLSVVLKDYGLAVDIPNAGVKEWWQEYPQTKP